MTPLTRRLYAAWKQAVLENKVINQFEAALDDPDGRWVKGDRIIYGVTSLNQQFVYYARNLTRGCDIKSATAQKQVSDNRNAGSTSYLCRLNGYRALRPGSGHRPLGRQPDISADSALCRFHCQNKAHPISLLRREPLLLARLTHFTWRAYYNVAPLDAEGHFLWIPTIPTSSGLTHMLQRLTPALIEDALQLFGRLSHSIFFFNALHAGASVNHIHFQSVSHYQPLPVESSRTMKYKGYDLLDNYPVQAAVFNLQQQSGRLVTYITHLQRSNIPFNWIMLSDLILVVARNGNNAIVSEFPGDGLAALGMCGAIATVDRNAFETVTAARIESAFQKMVIPASHIIDSLL